MNVLLENYGDVLIAIICSAVILLMTDPVLTLIGTFVNDMLTMLMG